MIKKLLIPFSLIILFLGFFYKFNDVQNSKTTDEQNNLNKILNISSDKNKIVLK